MNSRAVAPTLSSPGALDDDGAGIEACKAALRHDMGSIRRSDRGQICGAPQAGAAAAAAVPRYHQKPFADPDDDDESDDDDGEDSDGLEVMRVLPMNQVCNKILQARASSAAAAAAVAAVAAAAAVDSDTTTDPSPP